MNKIIKNKNLDKNAQNLLLGRCQLLCLAFDAEAAGESLNLGVNVGKMQAQYFCGFLAIVFLNIFNNFLKQFIKKLFFMGKAFLNENR
jgi:hypothetical protein